MVSSFRIVLLSLLGLWLSLAEHFSMRATAAPSAVESPNTPSRFQLLGPWSLSAGFPNGGSTWGSPALGVRNEVFEGDFISLALQFSSNKQEKSDASGVMVKWNHMMFTPVGRSFPYFFLQAGLQSVKESEAAKAQSSFQSALGVGVEVSLLREISTSFETGFGGVFWPSTRINYSTATTQISLHYHFQY
ncbi:MAG: hypothetical protein RI932_2489 [Pseudomonadota bacterium]